MFDRRFYCLGVRALLDASTLFIVLQVRWQQLHLVLLSLGGDHLLRESLSTPLELEGTGLGTGGWNNGLQVGSLGILGLQ
jgi:hypothetical protein